MMTHILEVVGSGAIGGGTVAVLGLAKSLVQRNFKVTVASGCGSYIIDEARRGGCEVLELDFTHRISSFNLAAALGRYCKNTNIALAHAHGARAGLPLALATALRHVPTAYTVHGFHYTQKPPGVRHVARQIERLCMARAAATVFVSLHDRAVAEAERLLPAGQEGSVIYNGADLPEMSVSPDGVRYDIAFLGRLHTQKNPLALVDILLALRPLRPTMAIIGEGEWGPALRERVIAAGLQQQVTFYGEQAHADGLRLLCQARVMVLPSVSEGLPLSVIEAMHLGIPAVASRVGGVPELIKHEYSGYLAFAGDIEGYAAGLRSLLSDPDRYASMAHRARQRARMLFTMDRNVTEHIGLYRRLLARADALVQEVKQP